MTESCDTHKDGRLLAHGAFMRFWVARLVSTMGLQMMVLALGWLMYEITADAWDLGLLGLYQFLPALALSLFAGQFADRHHRGRILAICIALQLLVALLLMAACLWGQITPALLMGAAMLIGISRTFQLPAQQALIPLLVPPSVLARPCATSVVAAP